MLTRDYGGALRAFDLTLGAVFDLEQACGKTGIGAIFTRLATHQYHARDVEQIILRALIGGGMEYREAEPLVSEAMRHMPLAKSVELAMAIMIDLMEGAPPVTDAPPAGDPANPVDVGEVLHAFIKAGIPPESVRRMKYTDFLVIMKAAGRKDADDAPSEEEFKAMVAKAGIEE